MGLLCVVKRGWEARDGAKAEFSLDWDCVSSLQSPVSANRTGGSVIFGLQLQENEVKKKKPTNQTNKLLKEIAKVLVQM